MINKSKVSDYRKDHNYICELREFTKKDILVCALHQEWVKRRYTKPTVYIAYIMTSLVMVVASFSLLINVTYGISTTNIGILQYTIVFINLLFIILTSYMLWKQRKSESSKVEKLNAIRDAIEEFSKTK